MKLKTTVKSCRGHLYDNCNAIEIALKAGDVGKKGCELYLVSDEEPANTTQEKLFLYSDADANAPLHYIVNGTKHTIQRGTGEDQLKPEYFNTLKAMFRNGLMNKPLYLSTDNLTDAELQAYSALLKITKKRGHTEFVKEDGILKFLRKHYFKNNEAEFEKLCQISEETLAQAKIRRSQDKAALENVFKAIAQSNCDADCATAIANFKKYLKARLLSPVTTFEVDSNLFLTALALAKDHAEKVKNFGGYYGRKADLVFDEVIGSIENILSVCSQMAIAQGVKYQQDDGEKFRRSLKLRWCDSSISEFLSDSGWVDDIGDWSARQGLAVIAMRAAVAFINFFQTKTSHGRSYTTARATDPSARASESSLMVCDTVGSTRLMSNLVYL